MAKRSGPSQGKGNLISILFVVGVIGWGFFAIDRFSEKQHIRRDNPRKSSAPNESEWKKKASEWLSDFIENKNGGRKVAINETRNIPVRKDNEQFAEEVIEIEESDPLEEKADLENDTIIPLQASQIPVYLYQLDRKGLPRLKKVTRTATQGDSTSFAFKALIRGPTANEEGKDFIDSFPSKPRLLGVKKNQDVVVLNFDSSFGRGVSFQTLRYQLRQLYEQAKHTQAARGISIQINGKHHATLSGDGITIPKVIDDKFFNAG